MGLEALSKKIAALEAKPAEDPKGRKPKVGFGSSPYLRFPARGADGVDPTGMVAGLFTTGMVAGYPTGMVAGLAACQRVELPGRLVVVRGWGRAVRLYASLSCLINAAVAACGVTTPWRARSAARAARDWYVRMQYSARSTVMACRAA